MNSKKEIWKILKDYTETSTVAGLQYAFDARQSKLSNIVWIILVLVLTFFGIYTSVQTYTDWKDEPVTTSVSSTGLPIAEIPFPSVVICSQGSEIESLQAAFYKILMENLNKKFSSNITPLRVNRILNSPNLIKNLTDSEVKEYIELNNTLVNEATGIFQKLFGVNADINRMGYLMVLQTTKIPESFFKTSGKNLTQIFSELFDPILKLKGEIDVDNMTRTMQDAFQSTDQSLVLKAYMSVLWYSKLPCFDVEGITSEVDGEKSMLKLCKWKGKQMPCSAIFQKVATDSGICCAFNMKEADQLFVKSEYTTLIKQLQAEERKLAFKSNISTEWYTSKDEPQSQAGTKMGLTVMLDAHSDYMMDYTMNSDYQGFTAMVLPPGDFPLTSLNEIEIKPGHNNMVALTAIKIKSETSIKSIAPENRKCYFQDEKQKVRIHRNYSQVNCLFECSLRYAQDLLKANSSVSPCTPWVFPFLDENHRMCDPWEKTKIFAAIENEVPQNACKHCLPDCNRVIYQATISAQKFRVCDEKNFGMSDLCDLSAMGIKPQIWGTQVFEQLSSASNNNKILQIVQSSQRMVKPENSIFSNLSRSYDAYKKDIAVLNVFFSSPIGLEYTTKESKNWFDFISAVGGNGGLFIGFSIVTVLELGWLIMRVVKLYLQPE